ncbi:MAG: AcrB/AcrD/AcrF family protein [Gammaproteobacteria bacterium]|nr:AcrB/AcrD/AcrF family protein [Gammaproteobacteria bacterium]
MAVQYESLLNPLIIMISIPFAAIGVALGLFFNPSMDLSMPIWLGLIMLTGIVVNNAIVLIEQIELERENSQIKETTETLNEDIKKAAALRLRPILMTTLTTVFGMMPLALGLGEGSEMLQPLAFVIVWGLSFSLFVSLILVPGLYAIFHRQSLVDIN